MVKTQIAKDTIFYKIENATVTLTKTGGQGILVKNHLILTAAHCIDFSLTGDMAMGAHYMEEIKTQSENLIVAPWYIEPISDIAILGSLDEQECCDEYEQFEEFCRVTPPIRVSRNKLEVFKKFKIFIYSHKKKWITGYAQLCSPEGHMLMIGADEQVIGGTSGSAIVNEIGEIVGIVSHFTETGKNCEGSAARPHLAVSVWANRLI